MLACESHLGLQSDLLGLGLDDVGAARDPAGVRPLAVYLARDEIFDQRVVHLADLGMALGAFTLYVGYYDRQTQGRTIHSPKNCLPGAGWEPLESAPQQVVTSAGTVTVNRYLLQNGQQRALVLANFSEQPQVIPANLLRLYGLGYEFTDLLTGETVPIREEQQELVQWRSERASLLQQRFHDASEHAVGQSGQT